MEETEYWLDLTRIGSNFEVQLDAYSNPARYRHRPLRLRFFDPTEPLAGIMGRYDSVEDWTPGLPPSDNKES